jgi:hypothetical protein
MRRCILICAFVYFDVGLSWPAQNALCGSAFLCACGFLVCVVVSVEAHRTAKRSPPLRGEGWRSCVYRIHSWKPLAVLCYSVACKSWWVQHDPVSAD